MAQTLAPEARLQFAQRLKSMRLRHGFHRARHFAESLGIEENRYTRYERAEVEPSLTLLHKICDTLHISPNELLGFDRISEPVRGFAESAPEQSANGNDRLTQSSLAWRLASETVSIRQERAPKKRDPLEAFRETARLFQKLQSDPFGTVAEIAADDALKTLDAGRQSAFAELVHAFTGSAT